MPKQQSGFTLVELAIVLMIIGLLIGGVLRGQEMMENSRITSTIQQAKAIQGAMITFQDAYSALPADISNPSSRIPNCSVTPCADGGNGNGLLDFYFNSLTGSASSQTGNEVRRFFVHLSAAHLIKGVNYTSFIPGNEASGNSPGVFFPVTSMGGDFVATMLQVPANGSIPSISGLFLAITNNNNVPKIDMGAGNAVFSPRKAAQFDRKMDDGIPQTGDVIGIGTSSCQGSNGSNVYAETIETKDCGLAIKIK